VGDGPNADGRADRLAAAGADVRRVSPGDLETALAGGAFLVIAQTGDRDVDRFAARRARAAGALAYAHDLPDESDLAMPAVASRGPLKIAVSTDGVAPSLARQLRVEIDRLLAEAGPAVDAILEQLTRIRAQVASRERDSLLGRVARRLRIRGHIELDPDDPT
jgi:siroheme synthase-like protein